MADETINTADDGWAAKLAAAYMAGSDFIFRDGAKLGIDLASQSLASILMKAGLDGAQITAVLVALGITGVGANLIRVALMDPEPVSRIALASLGAALMVFGSGSAFFVLTGLKPKTIKVNATGFEVSFHA